VRSMFACSTLPARLYRYCTYISVSNLDSLIPDQAFYAEVNTGTNLDPDSGFYYQKFKKIYS
jgi:hypothetical protein